jgi:crotonobetainyl-CoA:carnitine CoA-transferase CaiB-like acyl-CoA transferase
LGIVANHAVSLKRFKKDMRRLGGCNKNEGGMSGPIAGIKIIDMTSVIMGPYATQILADLGAEVIEIASSKPDNIRTVPPFHNPDMSGIALNLHRNKRSVSLDLKNPPAKDALLKLVKGADVFIHNMRHQAAVRLGIDYENLRRVNPSLIYCSAYGFSRKGPYRDKTAYDDTIQAGSGLAALYTRARGTPDYAPTSVCDKVSGMTAAYAILGALAARFMGRGGQEIEVPMFETSVAFNLVEHLSGFAFDPPLGEFGWARMLSKSRRPFKTADGYICLMPYTDDNWTKFFEFVGHPEMARDDRYSTYPGRVANVDTLYAFVDKVALRFTNKEWSEFCDKANVPAMPVNDLTELWDDPHLKAVGLLDFENHPTEGRYRSVKSPVSFFGTPTEIRNHAPQPGQDSQDILAALGYSAVEIDQISTGEWDLRKAAVQKKRSQS